MTADEPITLNWNGTSYTFTVTASDRKEDTWDMIRISSVLLAGHGKYELA